MKKHEINTCPGCSKHCPLNAPCCKYGRNYAARLAEEKKVTPDGSKKGKRKWKSLVAREGVVWQLLTTGKQIKKALRRSRVTEVQLLDVLSDQERDSLLSMLNRLAQVIQAQDEK